MNTRNVASLLSVVAVVVIATVLLTWNGWSRYRDFQGHQAQLTKRAVTGVANEIALQLQELRRRVALFAEEEAALIISAGRGRSLQAQLTLEDKLDRHFSDRFAYAIADPSGNALVDDVDDLVGDVCRLDISRFAAGARPNDIYIHPQAGAYHFDVMAGLGDPPGSDGVFFVSFHAASVARILENSELEGHRLYLLLRDVNGPIEVGAQGSRDRLDREFRLSEEERKRVAYSVPVPGTAWVLVDIPHPTLDDSIKGAIWRQTGLFVVSLVVIGVFVYRYLKQSEGQRATAEARLRRAQHELELRVRDRTQRLSAANEELQREARERRATERTLREREATLRAILDTAVDAIIIIDELGIVRSFNGAAERMFGFSSDEMAGQNVSSLMPSPYREEHDGYLRHHRETGEKRVIGVGREVYGQHRDGTTFPVHLAVSTVDLGKRKLFAGILRDLRSRAR